MNYLNLAKQSRASQDWFELWQLLEIVAQTNPVRILEIGVHRGGFVETLRQAFPDALIVGVDMDYKDLEFTDFHALGGNSHMPSMREAVHKAFKFERVDFLFIDGDHTFEGAKKDFEMYKSLVREGGVIGFHDIMRLPGQVEGVEVRALFDDIKDDYPSVELWNGPIGTNSPGTGVIFV